MTPLQAAILGLVEGITEYLPVSSTGHLIIASNLLGLGGARDAASEQALKHFEIVIQGGAILAVLALYWPRFVQMLRGLLGKDPAGLRLFINLAIAFVPAAAVGLVLHKRIEEHLSSPGPVIAAFIIGGVYMLIVEGRRAGRIGRPRPQTAGSGRTIDDLTPRDAIMIGLLQCFSLWPGTSRSLMTITGGLFAGLRPAAAAEFSFLLGMPTLLAATGFTLFKDLRRSHHDGTPNLFQTLGPAPVVIGMIVAAVSAALAVRWLVAYLNRHGLAGFGWYRIALGITLIGLVVGGIVRF
jgi:undecaprenyl-diphosphatase